MRRIPQTSSQADVSRHAPRTLPASGPVKPTLEVNGWIAPAGNRAIARFIDASGSIRREVKESTFDKAALSRLENVLAAMEKSGDPLEKATWKYVVGSDVTVSYDSSRKDDAQASKSGKEIRIVLGPAGVRSDELLKKVLIHEVNHAKNEVGEGKMSDADSTQKGAVQFATEFRAYFVAGNWPSASGTVPVNDATLAGQLAADGVVSTGGNSFNKEELFQWSRRRVLSGSGPGEEKERSLRGLLAHTITTHIHKDYPATTTKDKKVNVFQEAFVNQFVDKGVLGGVKLSFFGGFALTESSNVTNE